MLSFQLVWRGGKFLNIGTIGANVKNNKYNNFKINNKHNDTF